MSSTWHTALSPAREVRPLRREDVSRVLEIERRGYSHPWSEGVFHDCFRSDYRLWALSEDGFLLGYAVVAYMVDEAHLLNLCVTPEVRRSGAGRLLLRHLITLAAQEGMSRVVLEVRMGNQTAADLYTSEGFEQIGIRPQYYPAAGEREAARVMALSLPTS
ncbi:ribosomal protein S18-alanine N-acetyltransferase [Marinobacter sp.]|uniref:ribosomal protein S18-alanine N-acetyltransferase n=1 Tax=Marinobacter sp. TaxID=50741 RepID=UPI003850DD58